MGVLDEAIREHLELKRLHGADPGEIARLEQEALGPARRGADELSAPASIAPEADVPEPAAHEEHPSAYDAATTVHGPAATEPGHALADDDEFEYEYEYDEPEGPSAGLPPSTLQPTAEFAVDEELAPPPAPPPVEPPDDAPAHLEPVSEDDWEDDWDDSGEEPSVPAAPPAAASPAHEGDGEGGDDVLEETPEFLQETPEHDRLWFEQKPPRDFDF